MMERFVSLLLVASTATARKVVVLDNNDWDSVVVTTSPVKITNSRFNQKNQTKDNSINFNSRMLKECDEKDIKCIYDNQLQQNGQVNPQETVQKFLDKYAAVTNVKINEELRNATPKAYWNEIDTEKHNHPFDDQKGWVTLDPIPWSESKVTKWKPHRQPENPWNTFDYQARPTSSVLWVTNNVPEPNRPSATWGLGSNDIITDNRPAGFPTDGSPYPPTRPQYPSNGYNPEYAALSSHHYSPGNHHNSVEYKPVNLYQPHKPQYSNRPQPTYTFPSTNQPPYQWQHTSTNGYAPSQAAPAVPVPQPSQSVSHPSSYPEAGQGEWVLLSTTKGYSVPQRYHDRKMNVKQIISNLPAVPEIDSRTLNSKYEEKHIENKFIALPDHVEGNRKSDIIGDNQVLWNVDGINILHARHQKAAWAERPEESTETMPFVDNVDQNQDAVFKRTVRLTVLPALNNTSTLSHGGMLEVDANPQSVDDAQKNEERLKKLQQLAIVNRGQQQYRLIDVTPKLNNENEASHKKAAVLAAVGAGMIPATMAMLLPVALGKRRRRDVRQYEPLPLPQALIR